MYIVQSYDFRSEMPRKSLKSCLFSAKLSPPYLLKLHSHNFPSGWENFSQKLLSLWEKYYSFLGEPLSLLGRTSPKGSGDVLPRKNNSFFFAQKTISFLHLALFLLHTEKCFLHTTLFLLDIALFLLDTALFFLQTAIFLFITARYPLPTEQDVRHRR